MNDALTVREVCAGYGALTVLHDVSLSVQVGEIVSIIGANGAGKSTLMGVLSGLVACTAGSLSLFGEDITTVEAHERVPRGIILVPEGRKIFPRLSVDENLDLGAFTRRDTAQIAHHKARVFELFPILAERRAQRGGTLSGGEQQMLAIGRALMGAPKVLLLDEPSMGVAPLFCEKIFQTIQLLNRDGITILLVEQNAHLALQLAHRGYVMETGRITISGSGQELRADSRIKAAYLG